MPDLLFEIGTEELPPACVPLGETQLGDALVRLLSEHRLTHATVRTFATPRRLAVLVESVADVQDAVVDARRGPPVASSFLEDGSFAPAAVGFARANGVEPSELVRRETPQGEYLYLEREVAGEPAADVLGTVLAAALESLRFARTMRWNASGVRFPRPIRWLVALLGDQVVLLDYAGLRAGRETFGHRVHHPGVLSLGNASEYVDALRAAGVIADRSERRETVRAGAEASAQAFGGGAVIRERVLDEVTDLVENPVALTGRFDPAYLEIPRDVLVTAMEAHQRYFAVEDASGKLLPGFVAVSNADAEAGALIIQGNERVLRARLEDARFFFTEDLKVSMADRAQRLSEIVLHEGLGTMKDKVVRVGVLLGRIVKWLELSDDDADAAYAAADVCKADLTTHLVHEFPELQGVVGREYARLDPDLDEALRERVADAVFEHYLPRAPGDDVPASPAGVALGVADRLDTLVGYIGRGLVPTASEDPYALRRAATGLAQLGVSGARFPLADAIGAAYEQYQRGGVELEPKPDVVARVAQLVVARASAHLERDGVRRLFVAAARDAEWADLPDLAARARALQAYDDQGSLHPVVVVFERCHNILKGEAFGDVDPDAFTHEAERDLYGQVEAVEEIARERASARDYRGALEVLQPLSSVVAALFDAVLVDDPDSGVRRNRKALLQRAARVFYSVADFSGVEPKLLDQPGQRLADDQD